MKINSIYATSEAITIYGISDGYSVSVTLPMDKLSTATREVVSEAFATLPSVMAEGESLAGPVILQNRNKEIEAYMLADRDGRMRTIWVEVSDVSPDLAEAIVNGWADLEAQLEGES